MNVILEELSETAMRAVAMVRNSLTLIANDYLPKIFVAAVILFAGWLAAVVIRKVIVKLSRGLGLDIVGEKTGLRAFLTEREITYSPSGLLGLTFYWLILFSALITAFDFMGLATATSLLKSVYFYIPKLIAGIALIAIGIFLADWLGKFVTRLARLAHIPLHKMLGQTVRMAVIILTGINVLEFLGIASQSLVITVLAGGAILIAGAFLVFTVCARSTAGSILSRSLLRAELKEGDKIAFGAIQGEIEKIDIVRTRVRTARGRVLIPNVQLLEGTVEILDAHDNGRSQGASLG